LVVVVMTCPSNFAEEKAKYAARCPIKQLKAHLLDHGLATEEELKAIDSKVTPRTLPRETSGTVLGKVGSGEAVQFFVDT
jgi:hypothetical protein